MQYLKQRSQEWLAEQPEIWEMPAYAEYGKRAIMYSGLDGKRNFAWIGLPEGATAEHPVPCMVLVHGGGGTAFADWADIWTRRGYAAIAMDTCGQLPDIRNQYNNWPRHSYAGPAGWGAFDQAALPPEDQWFTHAIAAVIKAVTVLCSLPEVDSSRIGMTGISWGSVLAIEAAALDPRIKVVSIVYGSGFCYEDSKWLDQLHSMTPEQLDWWKNEWDASSYVSSLKMPTQWLAGTNDIAYRLGVWKKTIDLLPGQPDLCMKVRWPHGHGSESELSREIEAFINEQLRNSTPRLRLGNMNCSNGEIRAEVNDPRRVLSASLICTVDHSVTQWWEREWITLNAEMKDGQVTAKLPKGFLAGCLSVVSTDFQISTSVMALS